MKAKRLTTVDHIDQIALATLVAWHAEDPGARTFRIETDGALGRWAVKVHSKRWHSFFAEDKRVYWHYGDTLERAISAALDAVFKHRRGS